MTRLENRPGRHPGRAGCTPPASAYAFGTKFLDAFVGGGSTLGAAVRQARLDCSADGTRWASAYVAYGLYDLRLAGNAQDRAAA